MIAFIWKLIDGGLWKPILKGLAMAGLYFKIRVDANAKADARQAKATIEGIRAGSKASAKASTALRDGKTPDQIRRENDGAWD